MGVTVTVILDDFEEKISQSQRVSVKQLCHLALTHIAMKLRLKIFLMIIFLQYLPCSWSVMDIRMEVIRILIGRPDFRTTYRGFRTDPDAGMRNSQKFQQEHGHKSQKLIDSFSDARSRFRQPEVTPLAYYQERVSETPRRRHHREGGGRTNPSKGKTRHN